MTVHLRSTVLGMLLGFTLLGAPDRVRAQDVDHQPTFLAIPQTFPDIDARAVLMLEPGRDIVILRADDAEPETLQIALEVLDRMRRDHPRPEARGQLVPITGFAYRSPLAEARRAELQALLDELRQRPLGNVGNLGLGHWMPYVPGVDGQP